MRTHGTVKLIDAETAKRTIPRARGAVWLIQAEPQVMMRIKRHFAKVNKSDMGGVTLSDTVENSRELEWFLAGPYPLAIDGAAIAHLDRQGERHRKRAEMVEAILSGRYHGQPARDLAIPLRAYQLQARDLILSSRALILADDVGLGKTASAIGVFTDAQALPAVVVTLTHLTTQWAGEIARFAPHLRVHVIKKGIPYDLTRKARTKVIGQAVMAAVGVGNFPDVLILNYAKLAGWAETLAPHIKTIVFDECQELRHTGTQKHRAATHLAGSSQYRVGLSATPIYNYGSEFHSVVDVIAPDALGTREEFLREWCTNVSYQLDQKTGSVTDKALIRDPIAFGLHLRDTGLMLRRTRKEVGRELPPVSIIEQAVDADPGELDKVATSASELARTILNQGAKNFDRMQAAGQLDAQLRQATGIAKAPHVAEFVRLLVEAGEKVVLFGWHHAVYEIWKERLKDLGIVRYSGQETTPQKEAAKRAFVEGRANVMVISLRAGAGLDGLQKICRTVVFGELDWSGAVHLQNVGRVARDGQLDPVAAYFMLSQTGSDPVIWDVNRIKDRQLDGVVNPDAPLVEALQVDPERLKKLAAAFLRQRGELH